MVIRNALRSRKMQFTSVEVNIYPQNYHTSSSISKYNITSQKNVFVIFNSTEIFFFKSMALNLQKYDVFMADRGRGALMRQTA